MFILNSNFVLTLLQAKKFHYIFNYLDFYKEPISKLIIIPCKPMVQSKGSFTFSKFIRKLTLTERLLISEIYIG
jgi:hypothetical protein